MMSKDTQKPRRPFWTWVNRIGLGLLGLIVVGILVIFAYSRIKDAQASQVEPPEGAILVDVGGRNIYMRGLGLEYDGPAVVLISGFAGGTTDDSGWWAGVQPALAESMRVYTFDYAGYAWSDLNPDGLSHDNAADDLHEALVELGEESVILVGWATGSNTTIFYADRYPDDPLLAGIVWLDPDVLTPELVDWYCGTTSPGIYDLARAGNAIGVMRLYYEFGTANREEQTMAERLSPRAEELFDWDAYRRIDSRRGTTTAMRAAVDHADAYCEDLHRAAQTPLPTDIPLYVVQSDFLRLQGEDNPERVELNTWRKPIMEAWYQQVADNSAGGRHIFITHSNHFTMLDQPDALIEVIEEMVEQVGS
jgi:pimeloyl-ACP methyl ester carboxylesterase